MLVRMDRKHRLRMSPVCFTWKWISVLLAPGPVWLLPRVIFSRWLSVPQPHILAQDRLYLRGCAPPKGLSDGKDPTPTPFLPFRSLLASGKKTDVVELFPKAEWAGACTMAPAPI